MANTRQVMQDIEKATEFVKKHAAKMSVRDQSVVIAELSQLFFEERMVGRAEANVELREAMADIMNKAMKFTSVDLLELSINHSGRGIRLLRDKRKKR